VNKRVLGYLAVLLSGIGWILFSADSFAATTDGAWSFCAQENGQCIFTGTQTVRYGSGVTFVSQSLSWAASCNSDAFGVDPTPGVVKHCEVTNSWTECANENGSCAFTDTETVRFGADTSYYALVATGGVSCNDSVFGDPDVGVVKHCDRAPTTWTFCSEENGQCNFSGTQTILYGANGQYETASLTGPIACNNNTFGNDPDYGSVKQCYVPGLPIAAPSQIPVTFPAAGTTFNFVNNTNGVYANNSVYWTMIGQDPNNNNAFVHVDCNGTLIPMTPGDNSAISKNGSTYANYSIPLSQCNTVTIPAITSSRIYLSVGSPMYLLSAGNPVYGYVGPNIDNPADANIDVTFDFVEVNVDANSFNGNTTRVDQFGFPLQLHLQGQSGFDQTVGETESRANLFQEFVAQVPAQFQGLAQAPYAPYRIVAPVHGGFNAGGPNANYLDGYIQQIWNQYTTNTLTFTDAQGTFSGQVVNGQFQFTDGQGTYYINSMPTTAMVLADDGVFNDATNAAPGLPVSKQLQIQAQLGAALNRHVAENSALWANSSNFYGSSPTNYYAQFWHAHNINGLAYGFSYDDVNGYSTLLSTANPTVATITIGW
jgi:hypothetical protein